MIVAFRQIRSRRDAAAHDRPAKIALAPQPAGFIDTLVDILARAEHEQQVGGPSAACSIRCRALIAAISASVGRSRRCDLSRQAAIYQEMRRTSAARLRRFAKSHFVSLDCEQGYGSSASGSWSKSSGAAGCV